MIFEERIYDLHPGKTPEYQAIIENEGIAIQRPVLGRLVGYYVSDIGPLHQIVHIWGYDSIKDRAARRQALLGDPRWRAIGARLQPLCARQQNKILLPLSFSPEPRFESEASQSAERPR
jgi:hypothetical protein